MLMRMMFAGLAAALAMLGTAGTGHAEPARAVVVIVPGQYLGALPYQPLAAALRADGYEPVVLDLKGIDIAADAGAISGSVAAVAAANPGREIALVGHSIGALSTRYYLRELGGTGTVARYVAIGAPQYGSPGACGQPGAPEACPGTPFMANLNAGDDTPGATAYYSIRSEREWSDGRLDGGQCRLTPFPTLGNGGIDHSLEPVLPAVLEQLRSALAGGCAGEYADEPDGAITAESTLFPSGIPFG
ncbi:esterase/lipase family protein [Nocardia harenae]|uniref:esterase/lipase family protein n=1 Tax=Nocardia harenae TaxID=358707 RepID=UPI00082BB715|nr:lipase [Nocardia harenae]